MLQEGNRLRERGVDVVAAYVEPHARPETAAQLGALEMIPPRESSHAGVVLKEMDLDAVLKRRPTVALVDEFAHTNAPDSRNAKRYQDVLELLDAGISVLTTLNVQHLESLCNVVEKATGVTVRERIPDALLAEADQIATIDLPAEDLIERLKAGKIYPSEQAARALENFFTPENLTRLRELAFSEAANVLDRVQRRDGKRQEDDGPGPVARVMVAVSSQGPDPQALLRKASRLATRLNATWYAVYVRTAREGPRRIDAALQRRLGDTLAIAQTMGGSVVILRDDDVVGALVRFARENGITHLVSGRPGPRTWRTLFRASLTDRLAAALPGVDLILS
jgi:two-component system sensor histidine kinase KdpD